MFVLRCRNWPNAREHIPGIVECTRYRSKDPEETGKRGWSSHLEGSEKKLKRAAADEKQLSANACVGEDDVARGVSDKQFPDASSSTIEDGNSE